MSPKIIVSLTSHPARTATLKQVLDSLYKQTLKPDRIVLYLAREQYPRLEDDLPQDLVCDLKQGKFELRWCDNLGSHKKYFYAFQEFCDDIVITVDDDVCYHPDTVRLLCDSYHRHPKAVSALTVYMVLFDDAGEPLAHRFWPWTIKKPIDTPSMQLIACGAGGVLYPPHVLDGRVFDKGMIIMLRNANGVCEGDDLWLKVHEVLAGTPVVLAEDAIDYRVIPGTHASSLGAVSNEGRFQDACLTLLRAHYMQGETDIVLGGMRTAFGATPLFDEKSEEVVEYPLERCFHELGAMVKNGVGSSVDGEDANAMKELLYRALRDLYQTMVNGREDIATPYIAMFREVLERLPASSAFTSQSWAFRALAERGEVLPIGIYEPNANSSAYLKLLARWDELADSRNNCDQGYMNDMLRLLDRMSLYASKIRNSGQTEDALDDLERAIETKRINLAVRQQLLRSSAD